MTDAADNAAPAPAKPPRKPRVKPKRKAKYKPPSLRPVGRPKGGGLYDPAISPNKIFNLALLGLKDTEIAPAMDITESGLTDWKQKYPEVIRALKEGRESADSLVARRLFDRAIGMKQTVQKAVATKQGLEIVEIEETLAPDVRAQQMWLYNRQPQRWRERRQVELTGGIEIEIAQMPPQERLQRLRELTLKAGLLLEGEAVDITDVTPDEGE